MKWIACFAVLLTISACTVTRPFKAYTVDVTPRIQSSGLITIGPVVGSSKLAYFAGIPVRRNGGFTAAYANALDQVPEATAIVNQFVDRKTFNLLGIYYKEVTLVYGVAVRDTTGLVDIRVIAEFSRQIEEKAKALKAAEKARRAAELQERIKRNRGSGLPGSTP
jgi:hypothetical protein